ncbi:XdhC family protein [Rhodobacteraceae bacterium N5(2021)]|uniref:XdhC family protein n=1 Tax=Gymnodinialimonas phycosphaerae TaxID=2841589 RepID=A0A975TXM3_9RHOB|nr:XdhC family protein [Gymnodinialimonas phycosphaerae]MBY4891849.1 XdhC family protein [Gymnodinialimonas phycosphaerae]
MKTLPPDSLTYAEHASDVIASAAALVRADRPFVLITSLAIEGGAAREVGSLALVDEAGEMTGYLSNGCIDRDIRLQAQDALRSGSKKLIRYGDGSRYVDLKLPCGGALSVLIDPAPDRAAIVAAAAGFAARETVSLRFDGPEEDAPVLTRTFTYPPRHRLVLAGRGAIFRAMAQIGAATGYEVHAMSPDAADLEAVAPVLDAAPIHLTSPNAAPRLSMLDAHSAFLTLFHDHDWEPALLRAALDTEARFIGSLGSQRTHALRKEALRQMGVDAASLARLRGPIGLVPSLRDASSIAVSALAEVIATLRP